MRTHTNQTQAHQAKHKMRQTVWICVLTLFLCVVYADDDDDRSYAVSCGALLPSVAAHCSQPDYTSPSACCAALRAWNSEQCWCDPVALEALRRVSSNVYAYSGRYNACNITSMYIPQMPPPSRSGTAPPVSCVELPTTASLETKCKSPSDLALQRLRTLQSLDSLMLSNGTQAARELFRVEMEELFDDDATFSIAGMLSLFNRSSISDFFIANQRAFNSSSPLPNATRVTEPRWRGARQASYFTEIAVAKDAHPHAIPPTRLVFASFGECESRLSALVYVDVSYLSAQYAQYFWADTAPRSLKPFAPGSDGTICKQIGAACKGKLYPYETEDDCVAHLSALRKSRRLTCNRFKQAFVPQLALHGDSVACRATFAEVAQVAPRAYCGWLGAVGKGACHMDACPLHLYEDMFSTEMPRYMGASGGFTNCSETRMCEEIWP